MDARTDMGMELYTGAKERHTNRYILKEKRTSREMWEKREGRI